MSEEIIKVLDDLGKRFGIAINWSNENVMPYLQDLMSRFVNYNIATKITTIVICAIAIILSIFCIIKLVKWCKSDKYNDFDDDVFFALGMIGTICILAVCVPFLIINIYGIIEIITIPELTTIKYIQNHLN